MKDALEEITGRGNDAEIRRRRDGTYDVFELQKRKSKPQQTQAANE